MKKFMLLALAMLLAVSAPAYAEVQNIKVGGDITISNISKDNFDLIDSTNTDGEDDEFFLTQARVYIAADLTDNVQVYIRMLSEREWDASSNIGDDNDATDNDDVLIDLAYIHLAEFLYSPLSLTIGRQEVQYGSGMVLGDENTQSHNITQDYYGSSIGFDAIRADLDFDPWTLSTMYAKIDEDESDTFDEFDHNVYAAELSYVWPSEWLTQLYYVGSFDQNVASSTAANTERQTIAARAEGVAAPIDENLSLEAELAWQFGDYDTTREIDAWGLILGGTYMFDNEYKPSLSITYDFRSGDDDDSTDDYEGWAAPFYSRGIGNIIDQVWLTGTNASGSEARSGYSSDIYGGNIHAITTTGAFSPFEDIEVSLSWVWAQVDEENSTGGTGDEIGDEFIGSVTYDYTEDVTFSVQGSWFDPGDAFASTESDEAYELISSVSVEF